MEAIVNFQNIHNFKKWRKSLRYHSTINLWSLKPLLQVGFSVTWHSSVHKLSFSKLLEALFGRSFMRFFSTRSWWVSQHIGKSYFKHIKHKLGLVTLGQGLPYEKGWGCFSNLLGVLKKWIWYLLRSTVPQQEFAWYLLESWAKKWWWQCGVS